MRTRFAIRMVVATLLLMLACQKGEVGPIDGGAGFTSNNYQPASDALALPEIRLDADHQNFTIIERFVFLGEQDSLHRAVAMTFRRALKDNKFIRAERDFSGFVLEGNYWQALPYTKMRHDSTQLATQYPFMFGGVTWQEAGRSGRLDYNWRGISLTMEFAGIRPVQFNEHGENRRAHGLGTATLKYQGATITGVITYELICVEGYNVIDKIGAGIEFTNYDWTMLVSESGRIILASSDSTTSGDRILKNFLTVSDGNQLSAAAGSQYVRIGSDDIQRDRKILEWLASRKTLKHSEMSLGFDITMGEARVFYTSGYAIAEVVGTISVGGRSESAWGMIEHWQQPKSDGEVLR